MRPLTLSELALAEVGRLFRAWLPAYSDGRRRGRRRLGSRFKWKRKSRRAW